MNFKDFHVLSSFTRITGVLVNETPLRIGVGREPPIGAPVDIAVYRVNGKPIIPGSSLKGVFRSFIESIAASMGFKVHDPWDHQAVEDEVKNNDFCIVCGIFGNRELASHVRIYDAEPLNEARTFTKTGIGIDREFGGVKPGNLFNEELVCPGLEWDFRMDLYNIKLFPKPVGEGEDKRGKILRVLFDTLLNTGISVGARKSVGCGLIKLKKLGWEVYTIKDLELKLQDRGEL
jgi:CRISPR-associated RAMP protein (TIGR02581 family)